MTLPRVPHLVGFALATAFWPHLHSAALAPRWAVAACAAPILVASAKQMSSARPLLLLLWPTFGLIWSPAPLAGTGDLIHLAILIGAWAAGSCLEEDGLEGLLAGVAYGVALQLPLALAQVCGFQAIEQLSLPPAGLFLNRDLLGEAAAPLAIWAAFQHRRFLSWSLLTLVLLSQSRIAIGLSGLGLLLAPGLWPALGGCLLAAGLALFFEPSRTASASARLQIWQASTGGASLFGHGIGSFAARWPFWEYSHSDLLQSTYEFGVLATAPLAATSCWIVWRSRASAGGAALAVLLGEGLLDFSLHLPLTGFLAALLAGHLARRSLHLGGSRSESGVHHLGALRAFDAARRN